MLNKPLMKQKNRFFTLMVIPEKDSPKRLSLSRRAVWGVLLAIIIWVGSYFGLMGHDIYLSTKVSNLSIVALENKILKEKFNEVSQEMATINAKLIRMNTFSTKLRLMTSLEDLHHHPEAVGVEQPLTASPGQDSYTGLTPNAAHTLQQASTIFPLYEAEAHYILPKLYELESQLKILSRNSNHSELNLQALYEKVQDQHLLLRATPSVLPTRGWISSNFGFRKDPFTGLKRMHTGIDVATYSGSTIHAPADGLVAYEGRKPGYGRVLVLDHGYGITTRFAHNSENLVSRGAKVKRGDVIAYVGSSGRSTNSHLHYEVRINEIPVDPENYILDDLNIFKTATTKKANI
jgi:murein DD-endopeptidase MepM/ murein hydrolase activator NlpD